MPTIKTQKPLGKGSSQSLKNALERIGWNGSAEQEQAALRITIPVSVFAYLLLNKPATLEKLELWSLGIKFVLTFLVFASIIYASTILWPRRSPARRVIGILVDTIGQSYALYLTGPFGAPWYGLYLWIILGNGFRYGEKYLYLSTLVSLIGFTCVAKYTPYWTSHTGLAIGLGCTLLLIPAYSALLIRRLNEARQHADDANRAKSDFLSCMSHEIRTPLNGILGMTDLLKLRPLEPQDRECVETIHASGHALARQINEILDLSKIEAGQLTLEQIEFDLYTLINSTLRIFHHQIEDKHLQLQEIIDPETPFLLSGDPDKLQQIIINLVGNAIKFTERGNISVRISPRSVNTHQTVLRFEVADTGTGIPADRLQAIFEPFTQANSSVSRNFGGTGLGTTICKNLVELMGGQIGVQSIPNEGSTFWFEIPFAINQQDSAGSGQSWTRQCRVLYLNSHADTQHSITTNLREWNIPYDAATTLDQAARLLSSHDNYDALIIDNQPYDQRLIEIITGEDSSFAGDTKIILIRTDQYPAGNNGNGQDQVIALQPPLQRNILFNVLHTCYSRRSKEKDVIHFSHKQLSEQQTNKSLRVLVGDDSATNRIVLQRMLEQLGHQHTVVSGGEAILTALEDKQYDVVIVDKNMPDLGGLEAYQAYCFAHGGNPPTPFIILTADASEESRDSCKAAGIDLFLTKPVSLAKIQETLSSLQVADTDASVSNEAKDSQQYPDPETVPVLDEDEFKKLTTLTAGNNDFVIELIRNFESDAKKDLQGLESAVAEHNRAAFRDHAHALKGCALYLGLTRLAHLSKVAQDVDADEFSKNGIAQLQAITHATNDATRLLQEKITAFEKSAALNG